MFHRLGRSIVPPYWPHYFESRHRNRTLSRLDLTLLLRFLHFRFRYQGWLLFQKLRSHRVQSSWIRFILKLILVFSPWESSKAENLLHNHRGFLLRALCLVLRLSLYDGFPSHHSTLLALRWAARHSHLYTFPILMTHQLHLCTNYDLRMRKRTRSFPRRTAWCIRMQ